MRTNVDCGSSIERAGVDLAWDLSYGLDITCLVDSHTGTVVEGTSTLAVDHLDEGFLQGLGLSVPIQ